MSEHETYGGYSNQARVDQAHSRWMSRDDFIGSTLRFAAEQMPIGSPKTVGEVINERMHFHAAEAERLNELKTRLKDVMGMDLDKLRDMLIQL